jgi:hypothetical protein
MYLWASLHIHNISTTRQTQGFIIFYKPAETVARCSTIPLPIRLFGPLRLSRFLFPAAHQPFPLPPLDPQSGCLGTHFTYKRPIWCISSTTCQSVPTSQGQRCWNTWWGTSPHFLRPFRGKLCASSIHYNQGSTCHRHVELRGCRIDGCMLLRRYIQWVSINRHNGLYTW